MFSAEAIGLDEAERRLTGLPTSMRAELRAIVTGVTGRVEASTIANIGELFHNPARMQRAVFKRVEDDGNETRGAVGAGGLPYLRIQEMGGTTSAHEIAAKNARALAFLGRFAGGRWTTGTGRFRMEISKSAEQGMLFFKRVHHPGSVIPERSYLRRALAQHRADLAASAAAAAARATRA